MTARLLLTLLLIVFSTGVVHADSQDSISVGIFPYISPGKLIKFHRPLKEYLVRVLNRPVTLVTAPNFRAFLRRTKEGAYDYILTAPHFGRLAEVRDHYKRVVASKHEVQGIFLARTDSDIFRLEDLEGKNIMMAGKLAIIHQLAKHQLEEAGLVNGKNITISETRTHNNAMIAAARRETEAALTGIRIWKKLGNEYREDLRVFGTTPRAPGFMFMANQRMNDQDIDKMRDALLKFEQSPEGKIYVERSGFSGFRKIDDATMKWLDPYIKALEPIE